MSINNESLPYLSKVFQPLILRQAKDIVLSPDSTNPHKFEQETEKLVKFIVDNNLISSTDKVLDFGCGMGRISKELIDIIGCNVIGVDFSRHMLSHAIKYVEHFDKFDTTTYYQDNDIDIVIASLVLQHVEDPVKEIDNICSVLKPGGLLILINEVTRFVPIGIDNNGFVIWKDDGINIIELVSQSLSLVDISDPGQQLLTVWYK